MSLWGARFAKETDAFLQELNASIGIDRRMYRQDIAGSIAHVRMLGRQGIISREESGRIVACLQEIGLDIEEGRLLIDEGAEDIHMFIEGELTRRLGDTGKKLHTARSRNDQVALDFRMYTMDGAREVMASLKAFILCLCDKAAEHRETIMPGYTHLQRAQPITFAHHLMAYAEMFYRDIKRLSDALERTGVMPLGSGALATTTYPIDREYVRDLLGFGEISRNSLDGVSDRDFAIEMASALAIIMMHLSRLSEEVILWSSWEFKFIELDDAFATGSSIMPQKKNPDLCELIRGKSGRVYGNLTTLLTLMKGLPLAYNKDMQEDKEALFDSFETVLLSLRAIEPMFRTMTVLGENMRRAALGGFINATDCADYLTKKGMPFRDAYGVIGKLVSYAIEEGRNLESLTLSEYRQASPLFEEDIYQAISLETCVKNRRVPGGPAPEAVEAHIDVLRGLLEKVSL